MKIDTLVVQCLQSSTYFFFQQICLYMLNGVYIWLRIVVCFLIENLADDIWIICIAPF